MFSLGIKSRSDTLEPPSPAAADENTFLAAALAATLVEYRRHVQRQNPPAVPESTHWQTVARVERLMGAASPDR